MTFVWLVECKTCLQRFAITRREIIAGKSTDQLIPGTDSGSFECPHCHEFHDYTSDEYVPGEGRLHLS